MPKKKEIKRRKPGTTMDRRKKNPGRPSLIDLEELTDEMRALAKLKARGVSDKYIRERLNLSKYKVTTYLGHPLVQEKIHEYAQEAQEEDIERFCRKHDEALDHLMDSLIRQADEDKVSPTTIKGFMDDKIASFKLKDPEEQETQTLQITATKKRMITGDITPEERKRLLPADAVIPEDTDEPLDAEFEEEEGTEDDEGD